MNNDLRLVCQVSGIAIGLVIVLVGVAIWVWRQAKGERRAAASIFVLVNQTREEIARLELNILRPRLSLNLQTGRLRGLMVGEEPTPGVEQIVGEPNDGCNKCWGRGWSHINPKTKLREICRCALRR